MAVAERLADENAADVRARREHTSTVTCSPHPGK